MGSAKPKLLLYPLLVEPDDLASGDLNYRHFCLSALADHLPRRPRVALEVDFLARHSLFLEIPFRSATPRAGGRAAQHHLGHQSLLYGIDRQVDISGQGFTSWRKVEFLIGARISTRDFGDPTCSKPLEGPVGGDEQINCRI